MACARNAIEAAEEGGTVAVDFYHGLNRNGSRGRPSSCSRKDTGSRAGESVIESTIAGLGDHNKGEGESEEEMRLLCFALLLVVCWSFGMDRKPSRRAKHVGRRHRVVLVLSYLLLRSCGLVVHTISTHSTHSCRRPLHDHLSFYGVF